MIRVINRCGAIAAAVLTFALLPSRAAAQFGVGTGVSFESYSFAEPDIAGIENVSLLTVPVQARVTLLRALRFDANSAWATASVTRADGTESEIGGATDTDLALSWLFGDRGSVGAFVSLPTGHATHTSDEAIAAGVVAADLLPFRVTNWGAGGGAGVLGSVSVPAGSWNFGANAAYRMAQEFEPLAVDSPFTYQPGDELRVSAAIDRTFGRSGKLTLQLGGWFFGEDEQNGSVLYQSGDRYQALASYAFRAGYRSTAVVYAGALHRENGVFVAGDLDTPSQDLLLGGVGMRMPLGAVTLMPSVDARVFRREDGLNQGYLAGAGVAADMPVGPLVITPSARYRFGNAVVAEDMESGISGFALALVARFGV